ncbi:MAG: hypothetical protein HC836_12500 [Richelia sp. RM2_1_2]|nr:hypothetical protein [Richelia sp. RM2_1_2]
MINIHGEEVNRNGLCNAEFIFRTVDGNYKNSIFSKKEFKCFKLSSNNIDLWLPDFCSVKYSFIKFPKTTMITRLAGLYEIYEKIGLGNNFHIQTVNLTNSIFVLEDYKKIQIVWPENFSPFIDNGIEVF